MSDPLHKAALETIRRYITGEITERQACDWFGVDRLTLRAALSAVSVPTPLDEDVRAGAALASALMAANYPGDSGEDVDRLTVELLARGYRLARLLPAPQPVPEEPTP